MSISTVTMEDIFEGSYELVPQQLDLARNSAFTDNAETIASVAFKIYDSTDTTYATDLASTMINATSYSGTIIQADVTAGTKDHSYILVGTATCTSGRKYTQKGKFNCIDITT